MNCRESTKTSGRAVRESQNFADASASLGKSLTKPQSQHLYRNGESCQSKILGRFPGVNLADPHTLRKLNKPVPRLKWSPKNGLDNCHIVVFILMTFIDLT